MTEHAVVQQYVDFWNAGSGAEQRELAAATFANHVSYHAAVGVMREVEEPIVDGTSFATGTDGLELGPDGRIVSVAGFLDRAPEGFAHADH